MQMRRGEIRVKISQDLKSNIREQRLVNFFSKGADNKYSKFCIPYSLSHDYETLPL